MQLQLHPACYRPRTDRKYNQCIFKCNRAPDLNRPSSSNSLLKIKYMQHQSIHNHVLKLRTSSALRTSIIEWAQVGNLTIDVDNTCAS